MVLPQSPQKEEALVSLLDQLGAAGRPGDILGDVDTQAVPLMWMVGVGQHSS